MEEVRIGGFGGEDTGRRKSFSTRCVHTLRRVLTDENTSPEEALKRAMVQIAIPLSIAPLLLAALSAGKEYALVDPGDGRASWDGNKKLLENALFLALTIATSLIPIRLEENCILDALKRILAIFLSISIPACLLSNRYLYMATQLVLAVAMLFELRTTVFAQASAILEELRLHDFFTLLAVLFNLQASFVISFHLKASYYYLAVCFLVFVFVMGMLILIYITSLATMRLLRSRPVEVEPLIKLGVSLLSSGILISHSLSFLIYALVLLNMARTFAICRIIAWMASLLFTYNLLFIVHVGNLSSVGKLHPFFSFVLGFILMGILVCAVYLSSFFLGLHSITGQSQH
jgi:hypothetical protein